MKWHSYLVGALLTFDGCSDEFTSFPCIVFRTHQVDEQAARTSRSDSPGGSLPSTPCTPESVPSTPGSVSSDSLDSSVMLMTPTTCAPFKMELPNGSYIIAKAIPM